MYHLIVRLVCNMLPVLRDAEPDDRPAPRAVSARLAEPAARLVASRPRLAPPVAAQLAAAFRDPAFPAAPEGYEALTVRKDPDRDF